MSINIDNLIVVNGTVIAPISTGFIPAGNFLTKNELIPWNPEQCVLSFPNATTVAEFFGYSSDEYTYARNYFLSYDTTTSVPPFLLFSRRVDVDIAPYIRGGILNTTAQLNALKAITSGSIVFDFDSTNTTLTGINLSTATSFSQVASIVQTALQAQIATATVEYSSITQSFTVSNGDDSGTSTVNYCPVGALATAMKLTQATGAVLSQGEVALTFDENMVFVLNVTRNWVGLSTIYDAATTSPYTEALNICAWVTLKQNRYVYVMWTQESNLLVIGNTSNIMTEINANSYSSVVPLYGTQAHAGFWLGIGGSINYARIKGALSFAYKTQAGLVASITTDEEYQALTEKNVNYYGQFSSASQRYNLTEEGSITGIYRFVDNVYNQNWLAVTLQESTASFLASSEKVSYNKDGREQLKTIATEVCQAGVSNAVIEAGNTFDQQQTNIMIQQAGFDITPNLTNVGYFIQVPPVTPAVRAARGAQPINIWYSNGGVVLRVTYNTALVL